MRMRKTIGVLLLLGVLAWAMIGCGKTDEDVTATETVEEQVVTEDATAEESEAQTTNPQRGKRKKVDITEYGFDTFELSSEDLSDGVWNTIITNTENGSNVSPQLSWEPVEGAECYVVYMIDTMAGNWVHWMSNNVTETELPQGWASADEYVGPYPPDGTHTYEIYVVALKQPVELNGKLDTRYQGVIGDIVAMDILPDGTEGNILGYGHMVGTYTHGD